MLQQKSCKNWHINCFDWIERNVKNLQIREIINVPNWLCERSTILRFVKLKNVTGSMRTMKFHEMFKSSNFDKLLNVNGAIVNDNFHLKSNFLMNLFWLKMSDNPKNPRKPLGFITKKLIKTERYQKNQIELIKSQWNRRKKNGVENKPLVERDLDCLQLLEWILFPFPCWNLLTLVTLQRNELL